MNRSRNSSLGLKFQSRSMSDPSLSDIDFKNNMVGSELPLKQKKTYSTDPELKTKIGSSPTRRHATTVALLYRVRSIVRDANNKDDYTDLKSRDNSNSFQWLD